MRVHDLSPPLTHRPLLLCRYYGQSKPFAEKDIRSHMQYLTSEQAMADFAGLIMELKEAKGAQKSAVIGEHEVCVWVPDLSLERAGAWVCS